MARDYIDVFYRRGDLGTLKHLEPVGMIDYDQQIPNYIISDDTKGIFLCCRQKKIEKNDTLAKIKISNDKTNEDKYEIDVKKLPKDIEDKLTSGNQATGEPIEIVDLTNESNIIKIKDKNSEKILDVRAWVGGLVTVGSGGTYATWPLVAADVTNFTSFGVARQISAVTTIGNVIFDINWGSYGIELDGGDFLYDLAHNEIGVQLRGSGTGTTSAHNFNFLRTVAPVSVAQNFLSLYDTNSSSKWSYYNNVLDNGGYNCAMFRCVDASPELCVYQNIFYNTLGPAIKTDNNVGNANSVYENNTIYSCSVGADFNNNPGKVNNQVYADCATSQADIGNLSVNTNGVVVSAANLLVAFESVTKTDGASWLRPLKTGALFGVQGASLCSTNTGRNSVGAKNAIVSSIAAINTQLRQRARARIR